MLWDDNFSGLFGYNVNIKKLRLQPLYENWIELKPATVSYYKGMLILSDFPCMRCSGDIPSIPGERPRCSLSIILSI